MTVIAIMLVAVYFRAPMLQYFGFYEPDGFYHFSVIRQAVSNGLVIPQYLDISGWPPMCNNYPPCASAAAYLHHEAFGIYWVTLIPYFFLQYAGVGYYSIMRLIPIVFAILEMLLAYVLIRYNNKDRFLGLLVMVLIALNMGNAARTSALIYRGDSFAPVFLLSALIMTVIMFRDERPKVKLAYALLAGFFLSLCNLVWNGGPFGVAVYIFAFALMLFLAFVFDSKKLVRNLGYMLGAFVAWLVLVELYKLPVWIESQTLTGVGFVTLFVPMIVVWLLVHYLLSRKEDLPPFLGSPVKRAYTSIVALAVVLVVLFISMPSLVGAIFTAGGYFGGGGTAFGSTIQELAAPSYSFLYYSFNLQNFATPMTLVMLLSTQATSLSLVFWVVMILLSLLYLFLQVDDQGKGLLSGTARFRFELNVPMLLILSFFLVTAYLQMNAIRFNALLSVPMSMLAAYTIYWLVLYVRGHAHAFDARHLVVLIPAIMLSLVVFVTLPSMPVYLDALLLAVGAAIVGSFLASSITSLVSGSSRARLLSYTFAVALLLIAVKGMLAFSALTMAGIVIGSVVEGAAVFMLVPRIKRWNGALVLALVAVAVLLIGMAWINANSIYAYNANTGTWSVSLQQADGINTYFLQALSWMKNNTPSNATVLTLWPDGSVVEGVANRTSVTDSVGSQNAAKGDLFAAWILNDSQDPGFLLSNITGMPQYLVVRYFWLQAESGGIFTESEINSSLYSYYGITAFSSVNETSNATMQQYRFGSGAGGNDAYMLVESINGTEHYGSWLLLSGNRTSPFTYTALYNQYDGNFTLVHQNQTNSSNAATFMVTYVQAPGSTNTSLTGAYMMNPYLAYSNMVKFLYLCGGNACIWNNNVAQLRLVYINPDTKIFQIQYNMSNATVAQDYAKYYG